MAAAGPGPPTPPSSPPPPPPSPPSPLALRTTAGILRRSFSLLSLPLLAVVLLLLALRLFLLAGTLHLSSLPDRDPALRSLLLRLSLPPTAHPRPRRPHLFHLSRASDFRSDVFFSDDDPLPRRNSSSPLLLLLLRAPKFPPNLARLPPASPALGVAFPEGSRTDAPHRDTPQITPRDAVSIVYTLALLSSTHSLAILAFILVYCVALGVVFLSVLRSLLDMTVPFSVVYSGAELGVRRLTEPVFLRWAVRDAIVQLLCICFFSDVSDQLKLFRMFVGVKLLPFSLETEELFGFGFWYAWETADMVTATLLAVNPFVVIMDYGVRRPGPDGVKEGVYLTMLMMRQAVGIKLLENVVCGRVGRMMLTVVGGRMFAMAVQAFAEVYFMVAWLVFYFAARCKDGELEGRGFGQGDLQECINGIR